VFFSISMEIEVSMLGEKKKIEVGKELTAEDLISKLSLTPDEVIVVVNNKPVPYTSKLMNGDKIKIIRVSSGG